VWCGVVWWLQTNGMSGELQSKLVRESESMTTLSNRLKQLHNISKFVGGTLVFLVSCVGEFGSATDVSFSYIINNPKFPTLRRPETIGKFVELFIVSVFFFLLFLLLLREREWGCVCVCVQSINLLQSCII
jgi:hypothetical protein